MMPASYWPKADAVNACIKNEAETADVSVLLAVHQPTPLVKRAEGNGAETPATEQDLLDAFTSEDVPGGYLLVPVTGVSGAGKSHVIRWLDAQLQRSAMRDRFHIIRIPKSASLRKVVELILDPLKDDPRYAKPRQDLSRAVAEVNVTDAVVTFRAHLENALRARREQMLAEFREHPDRAHLKALIAHAGDLPRLFTDAALEKHFMDNVLSRVVARALNGRDGDADEEDSLSRFTTADLRLPDGAPLDQAAERVRQYYVRNISSVGPERLQPVIELLNSAIDPAIGNVFQLEQSTGGITLQDIILAVRETLLKDGKDLVLLVEDFAALAGIQEVLLKVCIQEGEYEGRKVRATMRTALALTDGYLSFRDTILTRARREWVVGGRQQSDEEIKAAVVEMVGAYLNAARWGTDDLRRHFQRHGDERSLTGWLPSWRDEALDEAGSAAVAAFGYSNRGDALFPFNRDAIHLLTARHLEKGGRLELNPRRVINEILRTTLLMRDSFEAHGFPPGEFQSFRPNASLAGWIKQAHQPEPIARRLSSLLAVWGGNPADPAMIAYIHPQVFTAFHLPTPAEIANIDFVPEKSPDDLSPREGGAGTTDNLSSLTYLTPVLTHVPQVQSEDPKVADMRYKLEKWSGGSQLEQKDANELRKALMDMVRDAVDWPSLRIRPIDLPPGWIEIPQARGNVNSRIAVCKDAKDEDGSVRAGLLGAFRYVLNNRRWSYPEADDDYVASAMIVDRLVAQLVPLLVKATEALVAGLGRALVTQARIMGLEPAIRLSSPESVLKALFSTSGTMAGQGFDDNWDRLRTNASATIEGKPGRERLQAEVLERVACFQGTGKTPFAVDIVRLLDVLGDEEAAKMGSEQLPDEVKIFVRPISEARLWGQITGVVAKLKGFTAEIGAYVDEGFDKTTFVADLQEVVRLIGATGTPVALKTPIRDFERQLVEFQSSAIKDLVGKAKIIVEADREQLPKVLNALGALDVGLIGRTMTFLQLATDLVAATEAAVAREEANRGQVDPLGLAAEIRGLLVTVAGEAAYEGAAQ
ncbi:protein DpdH [Azospirillum isscasi]|nr:protein DpdH [Azospirillum isscasi]